MERTEHRPAAAAVVGVRFKTAGRVYPFETGGLILEPNDLVVAETDHGPALGTVVPLMGPAEAHAGRTRRVLRRADARDLARDDVNKRRERHARQLCLQRIEERRLGMKLVSVDVHFDASKAVFHFCAEGRVDFRELVRDLAQALHTRIEMKQIGARDETKLIGGVGPCGRELCCSTWLREFQAVSVKMAKEQGLSLNPSKLSGMCGRLKCCLRYEYDTYLELRRGLPKVGKRVQSVKGDGQVMSLNALKQTALVRRDEDGAQVEVTLEDLVEKRAE